MASSFLVLLADDELSANEETREKLARDLLRIEPLTTTEKVLQGSRLNVAAELLNEGVKFASEDYRRKCAFEAGRDLLVELLGTLGKTVPSALMPAGTQVFRNAADIPSLYTSSDGSFKQLTVYAAHPADANFFLPVATYHPFLVQEKRAEMTKLAAALGAKEIRLIDRQDRGWTFGGNADVKVQAEGMPVCAGAEASGHASSATAFNLHATYPMPKVAPALPANLRWYHTEPLWQAMAETRLQHGALSFKVQFTYDQDFGVNAALSGRVAGFGLSVGGSFTSMEKVEQAYEITFYSVEQT